MQSKYYGKSLISYCISLILLPFICIPVYVAAHIITEYIITEYFVDSDDNKKVLTEKKTTQKQKNQHHKIAKKKQQKENEKDTMSTKDGLAWILLLLTYAYLFFSIRQQNLCFNEKGIYAKVGLLPWTKGYMFFRWQDIERVGFTQGPLGFLFASSHVHIVRRYSGQDVIFERIFRGKQFCGEASHYLYNIFEEEKIKN
ncbi:MAG: hypothetical protein GKC53_01770 [Neisseriaceae bacterium]|nr:MAG: hypothetical protein GKC53_01770 [Neisseriaceae bacterium]